MNPSREQIEEAIKITTFRVAGTKDTRDAPDQKVAIEAKHLIVLLDAARLSLDLADQGKRITTISRGFKVRGK